VFSGYGGTVLLGSGQERPSGQEVGSAQQTAGTLMDCGDRLVAQQLCFASGDLQMMQQVGLHVFELPSKWVRPSTREANGRAV